MGGREAAWTAEDAEARSTAGGSMFTKRLIQGLSATQRAALFSRLRCRCNVAAMLGDDAALLRAVSVLGRFSLLSGVQ